MSLFQLSLWRRPWAHEAGVFLVFCVLTVAMTWPYAYYLRDAVTDRGDPYLNAWILWWDYHQTFRDPLHLFQAPIFYPYQYTFAFSEHFYGLALLFFPLFALGFQPLTVQAIATLLGFAFSGYGAFRLSRALETLSRYAEPVMLTEITRKFFARLAEVWPAEVEKKAMIDLVSTDPKRAEAGAKVLSLVPVFNAVLRNGISPTVLEGGKHFNVIPASAEAVLNVRTLPGHSVDKVVNHGKPVRNRFVLVCTQVS